MPSRKRSTRRTTKNGQKVTSQEELARLENEVRFRKAKRRSAQRRAQELADEIETMDATIALMNWLKEAPDCEKPFAALSVEEIRQDVYVQLSTQAQWDALAATGDPEQVNGKFNTLDALGFRANEACNPVEYEPKMQANETIEMYLARLKTTLRWIDRVVVENQHEEGSDAIADTTRD